MPTDTQAGWYQGQSANPLAAATAETDATAACVCACDQHTLDKLSQTKNGKNQEKMKNEKYIYIYKMKEMKL